jgi:hypothetical protein
MIGEKLGPPSATFVNPANAIVMVQGGEPTTGFNRPVKMFVESSVPPRITRGKPFGLSVAEAV